MGSPLARSRDAYVCLIIEPEAWQLRAPGRLREGLPHAAFVERPARLGAEHPRRHLRPPAAELLQHPVDLEAPEPAGELRAHVHGAPLAGLRRLDLSGAQRPLHPDLPRPEVEVAPLERVRLARPETGPCEREKDLVEAAMSWTLGGLQEGG